MEAALVTQQIPAQLVSKRYELKYLLGVKQHAKLDAVMRPHMAADAWGQSTISNVYFDTPSNVLIRHHGIAPAFFVASDRCAYYAADGSDFRITLDTDIRWRDSRLTLTDGTDGHSLLGQGQTLMEVKTAGAIPLWLVDFLTANGLYQVPFSKAGKAYLARERTRQAERVARLGDRRPRLHLVSGMPAHLAAGYQPVRHEGKADYA